MATICQSHMFGATASILKDLTPLAVLDRPFLHDLCAEGDGTVAGKEIASEPRGEASLPFVAAYSRVSGRVKAVYILSRCEISPCVPKSISQAVVTRNESETAVATNHAASCMLVRILVVREPACMTSRAEDSVEVPRRAARRVSRFELLEYVVNRGSAR